jgi:hypothetical protein
MRHALISATANEAQQSHGFVNADTMSDEWLRQKFPKASLFSPASGWVSCKKGESAAEFDEHKRHEGTHALSRFIQNQKA